MAEEAKEPGSLIDKVLNRPELRDTGGGESRTGVQEPSKHGPNQGDADPTMAETVSQEHEGDRAASQMASASFWRDGFQLFFLVVAFLAGIFVRQVGGSPWPGSWGTVFIALGTLCLGFGAGTLLYQRRQHSGAAALRREFDALGGRAGALVEEIGRLERKRMPR